MKNGLRETLLLKAVLPLAEKAVGTCANKWYRRIGRMNSWTPEQITEWQNQRLRQLVRHAYDHTIYYRRLFDESGLRPDDIQTVADLSELPVLTKETVNAHWNEFLPDNLETIPHRLSKTGGTTGVPIRFLCDEDTWGYVTAAKIYAWRTTPYRYGDHFVALGCASLLGKPSFVRRTYDWLRGEMALSSVMLNDSLCARYIQILRRRRVHYIYGYASAIYILAKYLLDHPAPVRVKSVFTTAECLTDAYRMVIEQAFGCRVMDCYGARDAGMSAYEIRDGRYFVGYNAITEVVDGGSPVAGTAVVTNVLNYSFPLIRYQYGDEVEIGREPAVYNGQLIYRVLGRTSDVMWFANGRALSASGLPTMLRECDIHAYEFRRVSDHEITLFLQPVAGKYDAAQEKHIRSTIQRYIGEDTILNIEHVQSFAPAPNGKRRYFFI